MDFDQTMQVAAAGMKAQGARLRIVAQNLANADSAALVPGGEPYRRQTIVFANELDRALGVPLVDIAKVGTDPSEFPLRLEPGHPGADPDGYVKLPNVNPLLELADMREAQRSFEANLNAMTMARSLAERTIDLLR